MTLPHVQRCRPRSTGPGATGPGETRVRLLAAHPPLDARGLLEFLAPRALPGVESVNGGAYTRSLRLPHGPGVVTLEPGDDGARARLSLADARDVPAAVERCRRLLDLDADPEAVSGVLADDPLIGGLVRARPGLRVPGHVDGAEIAVRAVLGQQVSVAGARTLATRLAEEHGEALESPRGDVVRLFPTAERVAALDPATLPLPRPRGRALVALCAALASGAVALDRSTDRRRVRATLLAVPGVGPWTAGYIAMRALGDPDVMLPTDARVRRACAALGADPGTIADVARRWRPWRSYALMHLWSTATKERP